MMDRKRTAPPGRMPDGARRARPRYALAPVAVFAAFALAASAQTVPPSSTGTPAAPPAPPAPAPAAVAYGAQQRADVRAFIAEVAARNKLDRAWVARIVGAAEPKQSIIDAMNRPAERTRAWFEYRANFLTDKRIGEGRAFYATHRAALEEVAQRTGVPGTVIAAIVGVETFYGRITGRFRVLDALATLAFDYPARAPYFRGELEQFLLLAREDGVDPLTATGSYAGAMGAPQFMPRSYRKWALDGDRDGRVDLWNDWQDVFESVAHYLVEHGWRRDEPIHATAELWYPGVEGLPSGRLELAYTVDALRSKGVLFDSPLPPEAPAMFVALRAADGPTYRVGFNNFWVITRYNRSSMYALAVSELAAEIGAAPAPAPAPQPAPTQ